MQGLDNVFEMSVNMDIRILLHYENGVIILRIDIGHLKDILGLSCNIKHKASLPKPTRLCVFSDYWRKMTGMVKCWYGSRDGRLTSLFVKGGGDTYEYIRSVIFDDIFRHTYCIYPEIQEKIKSCPHWLWQVEGNFEPPRSAVCGGFLP